MAPDVTGHVTVSVEETEMEDQEEEEEEEEGEDVTPEPPGWTSTDHLPEPTTGWWLRT